LGAFVAFQKLTAATLSRQAYYMSKFQIELPINILHPYGRVMNTGSSIYSTRERFCWYYSNYWELHALSPPLYFYAILAPGYMLSKQIKLLASQVTLVTLTSDW